MKVAIMTLALMFSFSISSYAGCKDPEKVGLSIPVCHW